MPNDRPIATIGYRICPLCEAACNLRVDIADDRILATSGDEDDTFSAGHVCPKGIALPELHNDPSRLTEPLVRNGSEHVPATWDEAFMRIAEGLAGVRERHGAVATAVYMGNPTVHNFGLTLGFGEVIKVLSPGQIYSAGSIDQLPKNLASMLMFGNGNAVPVPDIERSDCIVIIGANPVVSNGSLWIVPGFRKKLAALKARGGEVVVVDPRRSETAQMADVHLAVRPGTDVWLLAALCQRLITQGFKPRVAVSGFEALAAALTKVTDPTRCGLKSTQIDDLAARLLKAKHPVIYGRVGTTLTRYGTLTSFLIECVNVLLGVLDEPGGAMFPEQAYVAPPRRRVQQTFGRFKSRVRQYPEVMGELPVAGLAEEIATPGPGQLRALVTIAGNPVVSAPDSEQLEASLADLEFMVAVDIYRNETTRHADVILPGTSPFNDSHYDQFLGSMAWRNNARYSPPLLDLCGRPDEWRMMLGMAFTVREGRPASAPEIDAFEDDVLEAAIGRHVAAKDGPLAGRDPVEILAAIGPVRGMERLLDLGVRAGPWGDRCGARDGITLADMIESPHGIDQGALRARLSEVVFNESGRVDLAPQAVLDDLERLAAEPGDNGLLLIGRRNIQTNNSWLHNLPALGRGPKRGVLEMHPSAAEAVQLRDGDSARIESSAGAVTAEVRLTEEVRSDTVVLPHGFSEGQEATQPNQRCGPNSNRLAPADRLDGISGTAALNGIPVTVRPEGRLE